jgi:hypothetical protein
MCHEDRPRAGSRQARRAGFQTIMKIVGLRTVCGGGLPAQNPDGAALRSFAGEAAKRNPL